jgi:hypothetical protein
LFLIMGRSMGSTVPSASTTSRPSTCSRIMPCCSTPLPPALVETLPPIWQLPRAPRSTPNTMPTSTAASCTACRVTPACTCISPVLASMSSMRFMRSSDSATAPSVGTAAPASPVSPPCGTTAILWALHRRMTALTSSVVRGRTSASGCWGGVPLQSVRLRSGVSVPRSATSAPRVEISSLRNCS